MYNQEIFLEKTKPFLKNNSERVLLNSLIDDLDEYNARTKNTGFELFFDFYDDENQFDGEWNPYMTYNIRLKPINDSNHPQSYETIVGEISLKELDNVCCALCQLEEQKIDFNNTNSSKIHEDNINIEKIINSHRLSKRITYINDDNKIVSEDIQKFVNQPLDCQLYDLNRNKETILTLKEFDWNKFTQRWVNDIALIHLLEHYYNKCVELESKVSSLNDKIITNDIIKN